MISASNAGASPTEDPRQGDQSEPQRHPLLGLSAALLADASEVAIGTSAGSLTAPFRPREAPERRPVPTSERRAPACLRRPTIHHRDGRKPREPSAGQIIVRQGQPSRRSVRLEPDLTQLSINGRIRRPSVDPNRDSALMTRRRSARTRAASPAGTTLSKMTPVRHRRRPRTAPRSSAATGVPQV